MLRSRSGTQINLADARTSTTLPSRAPHHQIDDHLKAYGAGHGWDTVKYLSGKKRERLIRAKTLAPREASGDVLVILDSHCEAWLCGGAVKIAPCSRVMHVFRMPRPYKGKPGVDTNALNTLRIAKVWLGEHEADFLQFRRSAARLDAGDLSERIALRDRLGYKPFSLFIDNVYPALKPKHDEL